MASTLPLQPSALAVVLLVVLLLVGTPASAQQRPDCRKRCGSITVPYPFGIGAGCYRDENFELVCDDSSSPSRLTPLGFGGNQLANLSVAGEARAYLNATRNCYNSSGGLFSSNKNNDYMSLGPPGRGRSSLAPFRFSSAKNRLVALGCPTYGYFVDESGYYVSGCTSICRPSDEALLTPGPCTGVGCCQSTIPPGITFYEPHQQGFANDSQIGFLKTSCRYSFLVETEWFHFDNVSINRTDDFAVPVVLDWAIRNVGNCSAASRNATDYACLSANSNCTDSTNDAGYRCNCSKGYEGNPYLYSGCIDIDECKQNGSTNPCYGHGCTNTPGGYSCRCPRWSSGDATAKEGCQPITQKVLGGVAGGILVISLFVLSKERRKAREFYIKNGGAIVEKAKVIKIFTKEEIKEILKSSEIIGKGGFGEVHKGLLDKKEVVVKKPIRGSLVENKQLANEVIIQSKIIHKNILRLIGCCLEVDTPMLVYEFISKR